jgi:hypothetical protein
MPKRPRSFWLKPKVGDLVWCNEISYQNYGTVIIPAASTNDVLVKFFPFDAFPMFGPGQGKRRWVERNPEAVHRKFLYRCIASFVGPIQL